MRIVLDTGRGQRELTVAVEGGDVTVAEVLEAAGVAPVPEVVHVDGRPVPTDHTVVEAAVPDGAVVATVPTPRPSPVVPVGVVAPPRLAVVAGAGAGAAVVLDRALVVGRDAGCDLVVPSTTVSRQHCRVVPDGRGGVRVTDLDTTNGTWTEAGAASTRGSAVAVGEVLRIGAVVLRLEPGSEDDLPRGLDPLRHLQPSGGVPFNRPPRPGPPPPVPPVAVPAAPAEVRGAPPFSVAALVAPLVLGAVMVVMLDNWRYALFMALSPVLLLANWLSGRRRVGREAREAERQHREDLATFASGLAAAAAAERRRRWEVLPSVAEVCRRGTQPSTRLWERRRDHEDALRLQLGVGGPPWRPPLDGDGPTAPRPTGEALGLLEQWDRLPRSPVVVDLADGGVVGIVGERAHAVALARSLVLQACVHHGPADLPVAMAVDEGAVGDWDWATWLPHTARRGGGRRLAAGAGPAGDLLAGLRAEERAEDAPVLLLVVDAPGLLRGRDADARAVLRGAGGPVAGIVVAPSADQLPAVCDTVVEVTGSDGEARCSRPGDRTVVDDLLVAGLDVPRCRPVARRLAGIEDPEVADAAADLPVRVDLLDLLDDGLEITTAWARTAGRPSLRAPIGVGPDGTVVLDLVADGPHGLLGGTTGAGKSELLRSLVAGLAATHDPDHCTFVLVDYKGGAAFDACADLPHVVGLVTDLDEHLGERALRCLEAELVHREQRLRAAGASDLVAWLRLPVDQRGAPLPRLLVVVDEFATLKAELPDFVDALVGIAQRGRSLGVHLLLGTQRPSGAVDENVRANANLRVALRMTDDRDSLDVVGVPDAAAIPPSLPGRGILRTGPSEPSPLQTALVTGHARRSGPRVRVAPLRFGPHDVLPSPVGSGGGQPDEADGDAGPSDLERLVAACRAAFEAGGHVPPRTPWPAPLPRRLDPVDLPPAEGVPVPLGLLDDPDRQRQVTVGWDPARGNLLVHGMVGSGTTTTLATLALSAARTHTVDELHLHVLDLGRGELAPLAGLPHCGAVVTAREPERRQRLQAWWLAEAARRRTMSHDELLAAPLHVLVVDGLGTWLDELDDPTTYADFEAVQRTVVDAPQLRMAVVGSVPRHGAVRTAVSASVEQRLVHRVADPNDLAALGLRPGEVPDLPPGRAVRPSDGGVLQVAAVSDLPAAVAAVAAAAGPSTTAPASVRSLPDRVGVTDLEGAVRLTGGVWQLPVALDALTLEPVLWRLHAGEHALVLGSPGSGRSTFLAGMAALLSPHAEVVRLGGRDGRDPADLPTVLAGLEGPTVVLLDDAERAPDPGPALDALATDAPVRLVAAARTESIQADYGHWLRRVARSRTGLFLRPTGDVPGDLLGARLPRRTPLPAAPGRGWVVAAGEAAFGQVVAG